MAYNIPFSDANIVSENVGRERKKNGEGWMERGRERERMKGMNARVRGICSVKTRSEGDGKRKRRKEVKEGEVCSIMEG